MCFVQYLFHDINAFLYKSISGKKILQYSSSLTGLEIRALDLFFVFCERKSDSLVFLSKSYFHFFLKSDVNESLTVALL